MTLREDRPHRPLIRAVTGRPILASAQLAHRPIPAGRYGENVAGKGALCVPKTMSPGLTWADAM
jgi:hypothetical protein